MLVGKLFLSGVLGLAAAFIFPLLRGTQKCFELLNLNRILYFTAQFALRGIQYKIKDRSSRIQGLISHLTDIRWFCLLNRGHVELKHNIEKAATASAQ